MKDTDPTWRLLNGTCCSINHGGLSFFLLRRRRRRSYRFIIIIIIIFFLGKKSSLGVVYVVIPLFLLSIVYKNGLNRYPFILYNIPDIINVLLHYKYIIVLYNIFTTNIYEYQYLLGRLIYMVRVRVNDQKHWSNYCYNIKIALHTFPKNMKSNQNIIYIS